MADEKAAAEAGPAKKGLPMKAIIVVVAMLVLEAGAIVGFMTVMGKPAAVNAVQVENPQGPDLAAMVELPVLHEKFTNSRQGRVWIWDVEVIVQVRAANSELVGAEIEAKRALIRTGVSRIIAAAQHAYFNEPGRETLTRQILEFLNSKDVIAPSAEGEPRVESVLLPGCIGFPADY
jgi:flagellar basal body-associated protein FliL